jgi:hypothetical protein
LLLVAIPVVSLKLSSQQPPRSYSDSIWGDLGDKNRDEGGSNDLSNSFALAVLIDNAEIVMKRINIVIN